MAFKRQDPVRSKIVIDNKATEQVNYFNYLGNLISYEKEVDIDKKLNNCFKIIGNINNRFRPQKSLKKSRRKLYNTLAFQLCCTVEKTGLARGERGITTAIKKFRYCKGMKYKLRYRQNTGVQKNLDKTCKQDAS